MSQPEEGRIPAAATAPSSGIPFTGASPETVLLVQIAERLKDVEVQLTALQSVGKEPRANAVLEFSKVIFGGWPALGLLSLILFFAPLQEALRAIPAKVRSADEIEVVGISLKTTLRREAFRSGYGELAETLPSLSADSAKFLLTWRSSETGQLEKYGWNWSSLDLNDKGQATQVRFPTDKMVAVLEELESKEFVEVDTEIKGQPAARGVAAARRLMESFRKQRPGRQVFVGVTDYGWTLVTPVDPEELNAPVVNWRSTALGSAAVRIIYQSVVAQFASSGGARDVASSSTPQDWFRKEKGVPSSRPKHAK